MSTVRQLDASATSPPHVGHFLRGGPSMPRWNDIRVAWRRSQPLMAAIAVRVIPGPTQILSYAWATVYALLGRRQAILALVLLWFFNMFTHAFGYPPGAAAIFRHLTTFAAAISVLIIHASAPPRSRTPMLLIWTGGLSVLLVLHSCFFSRMPDISVLKAVSFSLTILTLLTAWSRLSPQERLLTERQVRGLLYGIMVLSAPLAVISRGYFKNGRGFQGLLEHPQTFGPISAIVAVWLLTTALSERKVKYWLLATLSLSIIWIYLAQARIGAVVFLVGMVTAIIAEPIATLMNRWGTISKIRKGRLALLVAGTAALLAAFSPVVGAKFQEFITKTGKSETAIDAAWESRGFLVDVMQQNIRENPLTGIGFGVASSPDMYSAVVRDPIFGLAIMATVEKGVLPVAIVEELGWPLALLFAPWFLALLLMAIRAGPQYAGVCAGAIAMNLSECVFFSPGGGGLIVLLMVTMAATAQPMPGSRGNQHHLPARRA